MEGSAPQVVWGLLQCGSRAFAEMEAHGPLQEADEEDGRLLYQRARRGGLEMAGDGFQELSRSSGRRENGQNPTDRGKRGAKINLLLNERGAPLSVVLTGSNRHDKISAVDLIVSIVLKRPAHKEQHLCADKAYDASEVREFAASEGNHRSHQDQPQNSRRRLRHRGSQGEDPPREEVGSGAHDIRG